MRVLGIIPARGGSKAIPDKNIVLICGKPLICYTIEAAQKSRLLTRCIVSTDSEKIADVCRKAGADIPFMRPSELAGDDAPTLPVLLHALDALQEAYDAVMILQPTSPLRLTLDIDNSIDLLSNNSYADSVISVVKVGDHHPARMKFIEKGYLMDPPFAEAFEGQRRQDLHPCYLRNGAIYLTRTKVMREQRTLKGERCLAYVMPEDRSVNIDSHLDVKMAQTLILEAGEAR